MNMFSLRAIIDDILLLVRNNNISESEDLSRALIAAWVLAYRAALLKAKRDAEDKNADDSDTSLSDFMLVKGPLELEPVESLDNNLLFCKKTVNKISLLNKDEANLLNVHDEMGYPIQYMGESRKVFHRFRKYTGGEFTYSYDNFEDGDYITVHGAQIDKLNYIWIKGIFDDSSSDDMDEDETMIPGWMIPDIKKRIMDNELSFMLARVSDDDNNSTLDGIKPQAPAVTPNEK